MTKLLLFILHKVLNITDAVDFKRVTFTIKADFEGLDIFPDTILPIVVAPGLLIQAHVGEDLDGTHYVELNGLVQDL